MIEYSRALKRVKKFLLDIGVSESLKGFEYLTDALMYISADTFYDDYKKIAYLNGITIKSLTTEINKVMSELWGPEATPLFVTIFKDIEHRPLPSVFINMMREYIANTKIYMRPITCREGFHGGYLQ